MSSFCTAKATHFFSKKFQHICVSLDLNFKELLTNDVVSFEQLGPGGHVVSAPDFGSQGPGLNPAEGGIPLMTVWHFIALRLSLSPFHYLDFVKRDIKIPNRHLMSLILIR